MKILLTGATGFIGSHFVEHVLGEPNWDIYSIERLSNRDNGLGALSCSPNIHRFYHDFTAEFPEWLLKQLDGVDYIVHLGAEVHALRSLDNPELFVRADMLGTFHLLEAARKLKPLKFVYVSSAEAVGAIIGQEASSEDRVLDPATPYAAAKAAGEILTNSYRQSFGVPGMVLRIMNIFGPRQDLTKFIPMVVKTVLDGKTVNMHVGPDGKSGSRPWLHVREVVRALFWLLQNGDSDTYHVVGAEKSNEEIIERVALALETPVRIHATVPGSSHNMRCSIKDTKLSKEVYCSDNEQVNQDLAETVRWYKSNREWLR